MDDSRPDPRTRARDLGLARLRRVTGLSIVGATALAGALAGLAANSNPGHKAGVAAAHASKQPNTVTRRRTPAVPLTPVQTQATAPAPAPVTTSAPPVAVTGTS